MSITLYIDANQYLDFYRTVVARKLLDSLEEQKSYLFVSVQIVDEVLRNKLHIAQTFCLEGLKQLRSMNAYFPEHLLGLSELETKDFREKIAGAKKAGEKLAEIVPNALLKISRSEDEVSTRLNALLDKSLPPTIDEMKRARERKERGNPPGKAADPLGDQISWEQLLTHCKTNNTRRIWIISRDRDYCIKHGSHHFLNSMLYKNLIDVCGPTLEINCFENLLEGMDHFSKHAGVAATKLPSPVEAAQIKEEIKSLPPLELSINDLMKRQGLGATSIATLQGLGLADLRICPNSEDGKHDFLTNGLVPKPSRYGGWSYWQICKHCGLHFDTGEPYDE